jgi:hypothetical protein
MARIIWLSVLFVFAVAGCSSRKAPPKKPPPPPPEKKATPVTQPKVETPKPLAPETKTPAKEPEKKEEPKKEAAAPVKPATPATPEKKEEPKAAAAPMTVQTAPLGPETGYENEFAGGKTIRAWIKILESNNKEQIIEALSIFQMVGKRAGMAAPKLEVLTKSSDEEIAKEARAALHAVKTKQ